MKKLIFSLIFSLIFVSSGFSIPINVSVYNGYFTGNITAKPKNGTFTTYNNTYISPIKVSINNNIYSAYCIDLFDDISPGDYNVNIFSIDDYLTNNYIIANNKYNDKRNLAYGLYDMTQNNYLLTDIEKQTYAQLNLWNILYNYYPDTSSFSNNFLVSNINDGSTLYDTEYLSFNSMITNGDIAPNNTYNTTHINSLQNNRYSDITSNYKVLQIDDGSTHQEIIIKNYTLTPEPATFFYFLLGINVIMLLFYKRKLNENKRIQNNGNVI